MIDTSLASPNDFCEPKIYAESFRGGAHLRDLQGAARAIVADALTRRGASATAEQDQL